MWTKKLFIFLIFLFLPSANALTIEPSLPLTGCPYNITEMVWYDVCLAPVEDATVYYNITNMTVVDPSTLYYPASQKLVNVGGNVYKATLTAPWLNGTYTASLKIEKENYPTIYTKKQFEILPDFPFATKFDYRGMVYLDYFNILLKSSYQPGSCSPNRTIKVECYVENKEGVCPILIFPGEEHVCTVSSPPYDFGSCDNPEGKENTASCKFYDPAHPWLFSWRNETFIPVAFEVTVLPPITLTVGQPFSLPITVKNRGLITDNYTVVVSSNSHLLLVEAGNTTIVSLKYGESGETYARINILAAVSASIDINITSAVSCLNKKITIVIEGGMMSLSEFDFIGVVQIILIAALLFALLIFKNY
ncbi:MAG: hypothetical protein QMD12_00860 [Candidatus Aenigmarchaeota archaeon]|nr:hypothetical protein [Candidatus Aenigmarchaeota archaeon]